jgi:hypothetical protein
MNELMVYETPRAQVRGVFLCENVADTAVSAYTTGITQEEWGSQVDIVGDDDAEGDDVWFDF